MVHFRICRPERSEEEIRELDRARLFAEVDYEAPLQETPVVSSITDFHMLVQFEYNSYYLAHSSAGLA